MCNLLSFLVDEKLNGKESEINEYAIGLHVFRRDGRLYDTIIDPVVRVQIGRLRNRLAAYYAAEDPAYGVQITIPTGSYVPLIEYLPSMPARSERRLELVPLRDLSGEHDSAAFVSGVDEELGTRLFQQFDGLIRLGRRPSAVERGGAHAEIAHRLEGSIRVEKNCVRASVRLIDPGTGHIAWASQFDCEGELGIKLQEELADTICSGLRRYLAD
jgi:TolB-like protein